MPPREVLHLPASVLHGDPGQPRTRRDPSRMASLRESIAAVGQLQPALVRPSPTPGHFVIVDGHGRVDILRELGHDVQAIVVDASLRPGDVLLNQLVIGSVVETLNAVDLALGIARALKESGKSRADICRILGMSEPTISRKLALTNLSPALLEQARSGALPEGLAAQIARAGGPEEQERLAAEVTARGLTRDQLAGELRRRKKPKTRGAKPCARLVARLDRQRTITLAGPGLDALDVAIGWIEELLAHARKARPKGLALATFAQLLRDQAAAGGKEGA